MEINGAYSGVRKGHSVSIWILAGILMAILAAVPARSFADGSSQPPDAADVPKLLVGSIQVEYTRDMSQRPQAPSVKDITTLPLALKKTAQGYVSTSGAGQPVTVQLSTLATQPVLLSVGAVKDLEKQIQEYVNSKGIIVVFVAPRGLDLSSLPADVSQTPQNLDFVVTLGIVTQVRTIATGNGAEKGPNGGINESAQDRIRKNSPIQPIAGQDLVNHNEIDDYLSQLNRQPGRQVEASLSSTSIEDQNEIALDYLVHLSKPWFVYLEGSNTGTFGESNWRERLGFTDTNLTNHDDIVNVDFNTASFSGSYIGSASYDLPLTSDDRLRVKPYGDYGQFKGSELGQERLDVSGSGWTAGAELSLNVLQCRQLFADVFAGARYDSYVSVLGTATGSAGFTIPYAGVRVDRNSPIQSTHFYLEFEANVTDSANEDILGVFGRSNPNRDFTLLLGSFTESIFLDPLLSSSRTTLVNELAASLHGQYAFDDRLIPEYQQTSGGLYTVRGYEESIVAGDSVGILNLEYRFHIPSALGIAPAGTLAGHQPGILGKDFAYQPEIPYGRPDWDLVPAIFLDGAVLTDNRYNSANDALSTDYLLSTGAALTFKFRDNLNAMVDYGWVLSPISVGKPGQNGYVNEARGKGRFSFDITLLY